MFDEKVEDFDGAVTSMYQEKKCYIELIKGDQNTRDGVKKSRVISRKSWTLNAK